MRIKLSELKKIIREESSTGRKMTVSKLIGLLSKFPKDYEVKCLDEHGENTITITRISLDEGYEIEGEYINSKEDAEESMRDNDEDSSQVEKYKVKCVLIETE
jgi:hypothetical protein